ncbi:LacI family DNA-binding transcriptional regulator [Streptomyces sp. DSM 44915]|uniref:LacI family DNA-binding transcriptional regulator n=1 Tax=Streptomyces chisholmiae TaxID=3075540 RepID=A0ABU2K115_9ACTN|nr:LacI family DNA-binding transcriptional regulator [Streptomyces sp. DSM 44915]MDT0270696.1 LacI family DNA-binding transcriptional regulator [Streptomyces sp. DSM 44915]
MPLQRTGQDRRKPRARASSGNPTLTDVAARAGVSLATASRVLNDSARRVGQDHRERVLRAARELNYRTDLSAQAMARGTAPVLALLVSTIDDPYFSAIAEGVAASAHDHGVIVTIAITARDSARELTSVRTIRGQRPRAILVCGSRIEGNPHTGELLAELRQFTEAGGRALFLSQPVGGVGAVRPDNATGARELGAAVADRGYRRAAVVTGAASLATVAERTEGLRRGLASRGGEITVVASDTFDRAGGYRATRRLVESGRIADVDVLCAGNDFMAVGAMTALRDGGIDPGRDIAVTGFNDIATAADVTPQLTTVHFPLAEIGRRAADLALDATAPHTGDICVPGQVLLRASCPPAAGTRPPGGAAGRRP